MSALLAQELHKTFRTIIIAAAIVAAFLILAHRVFPDSGPVHAPVAVFSPSPLEHELQAVIEADTAIAASRNGGSAPLLLQPAVSVIEKSGAVGGLSGAQIAQILGALKPKTVEKVAVGSKLVGPSPAPTPTSAVMRSIYDAAYSADTNALANTKIKTDVTITREEVAPSRVGSLISAYGSGLSFAAIRQKQYEVDLAAVLRSQHISPGLCPMYLIPHTQLSLGPCVFYDHKFSAGFGAVIHF